MAKGTTEADIARHYDETHDTSGFGEPEPVQVRRNVTISVRFTADELDALRRRADAAEMKVTAFIRAAALEADRPLDRAAVARMAAEAEHQVHQIRDAIA